MFRSQPSIRRRLPAVWCAVLAVIGAGWSILSLMAVVGPTAWPVPMVAAWLAANLGSAALLIITAVIGRTPRPTRPVPAAGLAAVITLAALPALAAIVEGFLGRDAAISSSASMDLLAATAAGIALVLVYRSRLAHL